MLMTRHFDYCPSASTYTHTEREGAEHLTKHKTCNLLRITVPYEEGNKGRVGKYERERTKEGSHNTAGSTCDEAQWKQMNHIQGGSNVQT